MCSIHFAQDNQFNRIVELKVSFEMHPRRSQAALKFDEKVFRIYHNGKPVVELTIEPLSTVRVQVEQTGANKRDDNDRSKTITIVQDQVYKYCLNVDYVNDLPSIEFEAYWVETRQFSATIFVRWSVARISQIRDWNLSRISRDIYPHISSSVFIRW